jgi:hypothetical protein
MKFPAVWRDRLPLLESEERLLWLVGVRLSAQALVQAATTSVIRFRMRSPGLALRSTNAG